MMTINTEDIIMMTTTAFTLAATINFSMLGSCIAVTEKANDQDALAYFQQVAATTVNHQWQRDQLNEAIEAGMTGQTIETQARVYYMCLGVYSFMQLR